MSSRVAYFTNVYPAVSHAFIRREILALERHGVAVQRIALRGWDSEIFDEADRREREQTEYVLQHGVAPVLAAMLRMLFGSPGRFCAALSLALRMSRKATRSLPYHLIYLAEACRIVAWLHRSGATHVHAHFGTNSAEIVMLARELGGPPYSFTVHGPLEFDNPRGHGLPEKIRRSAFTVAITSYTRSQLCRCVAHRHWPRIRVVRCGLDPEFFRREPEPLPDVPRLVCIGRLVEQKGQLLVEAAARLQRTGHEFTLALVGGGPMADELGALVARHGLESRIELPGAVTTERLHEELRNARGLVLPSFAEGLPMVIMEAMALRRPVVSTYVAGIPELVIPGSTGWLVPPSALDPLVEAMAALLETPVEELRAMGEAGFERVRERHCADTETARLAELFARSAAGETALRAGEAAAGAGAGP